MSSRPFKASLVAVALLCINWSFGGEPAKPPAFDLKPADLKPGAPPATQPDRDSLLPSDSNFIVHEWGTFTSFSGSDGVSLDFRTLVDSDLPGFVIDRPKQAFLCERRDVAYARGLASKGGIISRQRMETPVTYFYTDKERIVDVTVEFPKGLLTEFFPPVRQFGPTYKRNQPEQMDSSWLRWGKVRLLPMKQALGATGVDPLIPPVKAGEGEHYAFARETDSAHLQLTDMALNTTYREKFLFYRGVGNFDLPVSLKGAGEGRFVLTHPAKSPMHFAFVVQADAGRIRYARYENLQASTELTLPAESSTVEALGEDMVKSLIGEGLYEKEARAMVKTWRSSWFGEDGTRVLYALPQADTDRLLPLKIQPAPKETLRVMVGRLEILTAQQEQRIASLVVKLGAGDAQVRQQTADEIRKLGRFAESALTRIAKVSEDPETQLAARALLKEVLIGKGITPAAN